MKHKKLILFLLVILLAVFMLKPHMQNYLFKKEVKNFYLDKNIVLSDKKLNVKKNSEFKNYEVKYDDSQIFYANKGNYPDLITFGLSKYLNKSILNTKDTQMVFFVYYDKHKKILMTDYPSNKIYFLGEDNKLYYKDIEKYLSEKEQKDFYDKLEKKKKEFFSQKTEFEKINWGKYINDLNIYSVFYLDNLKENLNFENYNIYNNITEGK